MLPEERDTHPAVPIDKNMAGRQRPDH